MYAQPCFREERREVLVEAIREIRLAVIVTEAGGYHATHAPMVARERGGSLVLQTHFARGNQHWQAVAAGAPPSVAIFQGPQAYISPSWYASKRAHGKVVPTWVYVAVHAHGRLSAHDDAGWLADHLAALTDHNEHARPEPWQVSDAPADYMARMMRGIVGIELAVDRLEGSWKLNQHKDEDDRLGVIAGLGAGTPEEAAVSGLMRALEEERR